MCGRSYHMCGVLITCVHGRSYHRSIDEGWAGWVVEHSKAACSGDAPRDDRSVSMATLPGGEEVQSVLAVPIHGDGPQPLAVLQASVRETVWL